jgi:hypothetical protein
MEYLTAKQTIGKLKQGRVTDISEAYFSQLVSMGAIPFHTIPGKKRKLYLYDEVKIALANIQDPSRDAQREANAEKREANQARKTLEHEREVINANYQSAMELLKITFEELAAHTNYKDDVLEEAKEELKEVQSINLALSELVHEQKEAMQTMPLEAEVTSLITHEMLKLTVEKMMTIDDFYDFIVGMD